jgi:hypothetical protein
MKKLILLTLLVSSQLYRKGTEVMENQPVKNESHAQILEAQDSAKQITVSYKNYRGEVATRTIIPLEGGIYWGKTEYHPHDQWLLKVWDVEKNAERIYALQDIQEFLK